MDDVIVLSCEIKDKVYKVIDRKGKYIVSNNGEEIHCISIRAAAILFDKLKEESTNVA